MMGSHIIISPTQKGYDIVAHVQDNLSLQLTVQGMSNLFCCQLQFTGSSVARDTEVYNQFRQWSWLRGHRLWMNPNPVIPE